MDWAVIGAQFAAQPVSTSSAFVPDEPATQKEWITMTTFLFTYRMPRNYRPGRPEAMAAWNAWFEGMGDHVADRGNPVFESSTLGKCGADTGLGGYSLITADDLEAALTLAKGCPALAEDAGVEVGVITERNRGTVNETA